MFEKILVAINRESGRFLRSSYGIYNDINYMSRSRRKKRGGLSVSDHAVLRYLERFDGIDIDATRDKIALGGLKDFSPVGIDKFKSGDMELVIENSTVITVYKTDDKTGNKMRIRLGGRL